MIWKGDKFIMKVDKPFASVGSGFKTGDTIEYLGSFKSPDGLIAKFKNQDGVILKTYEKFSEKFVKDNADAIKPKYKKYTPSTYCY